MLALRGQGRYDQLPRSTRRQAGGASSAAGTRGRGRLQRTCASCSRPTASGRGWPRCTRRGCEGRQIDACSAICPFRAMVSPRRQRRRYAYVMPTWYSIHLRRRSKRCRSAAGARVWTASMRSGKVCCTWFRLPAQATRETISQQLAVAARWPPPVPPGFVPDDRGVQPRRRRPMTSACRMEAYTGPAPRAASGYTTAALVVEIVLPGDESWQKLPFYAAHRSGRGADRSIPRTTPFTGSHSPMAGIERIPAQPPDRPRGRLSWPSKSTGRKGPRPNICRD